MRESKGDAFPCKVVLVDWKDTNGVDQMMGGGYHKTIPPSKLSATSCSNKSVSKDFCNQMQPIIGRNWEYLTRYRYLGSFEVVHS